MWVFFLYLLFDYLKVVRTQEKSDVLDGERWGKGHCKMAEQAKMKQLRTRKEWARK